MAAPRKDNVKEIILETTEALLNTHSLDDISLADISKAAGISKGTLYYHYKAKEDILLDITDRFLEKQWNDFIIWTEDKNKDTSLHRLIKYVIERNINLVGPRMHLIYNASLGNEEVKEKLIERYQKFQKMISKKIAERTGSTNSDYLAWLLLLISDGLIIQKEINNPNLDIEEFLKITDKTVESFSSNLK
ncbi:MAG: TetR/AcrR family transcriptional regulator [Oscillospiraceae bacterium]|nr:TetR/AcrR family transcriptional regulator [Oscillospiraceae bacterium]